MNRLKRHRGVESTIAQYATRGDFRRIFSEDADGLYQLSFLLTGNHERAEQCFVAGLEDTVRTNRVFKEWARTWAKRTVIQQAIRTLKPSPWEPTRRVHVETGVASAGLPNDLDRKGIVDRLLLLQDFERCVFVMSVLERYSARDCALLLGCSMRDVQDAQVRAFGELALTQDDSQVTDELDRAAASGGERHA